MQFDINDTFPYRKKKATNITDNNNLNTNIDMQKTAMENMLLKYILKSKSSLIAVTQDLSGLHKWLLKVKIQGFT